MKTSNSSTNANSQKEEEIGMHALTKATKRTADCVPKRKQQTNRRERLFSTTQRPGIFVSAALRSHLIISLNLIQDVSSKPCASRGDVPSAGAFADGDRTESFHSTHGWKDGIGTPPCIVERCGVGILASGSSAQQVTSSGPT